MCWVSATLLSVCSSLSSPCAEFQPRCWVFVHLCPAQVLSFSHIAECLIILSSPCAELSTSCPAHALSIIMLVQPKCWVIAIRVQPKRWVCNRYLAQLVWKLLFSAHIQSRGSSTPHAQRVYVKLSLSVYLQQMNQNTWCLPPLYFQYAKGEA